MTTFINIVGVIVWIAIGIQTFRPKEPSFAMIAVWLAFGILGLYIIIAPPVSLATP